MADLRPKGTLLMLERAERPDLRSERPERPDLRPERPDLRPTGLICGLRGLI